MARGDTYKNATLDASYGDGRAAGFPATVYLCAYTAAPTDAGGGTEVVGAGYSRVAVANTTANWPNAAAAEKKNAAQIVFPVATANYPANVTHWVIKDAAIGGNIVDWAVLAAAVTVASGQQLIFNVNAIVIVCASA